MERAQAIFSDTKKLRAEVERITMKVRFGEPLSEAERYFVISALESSQAIIGSAGFLLSSLVAENEAAT